MTGGATGGLTGGWVGSGVGAVAVAVDSASQVKRSESRAPWSALSFAPDGSEAVIGVGPLAAAR